MLNETRQNRYYTLTFEQEIAVKEGRISRSGVGKFLLVTESDLDGGEFIMPVVCHRCWRWLARYTFEAVRYFCLPSIIILLLRNRQPRVGLADMLCSEVRPNLSINALSFSAAIFAVPCDEGAFLGHVTVALLRAAGGALGGIRAIISSGKEPIRDFSFPRLRTALSAFRL